ncbi:recombinase family protein [Candidatus Kaiserbacteria bacterium]|nr:recombinase family protein [Candidatus Kaiserbacteria bacterium]
MNIDIKRVRFGAYMRKSMEAADRQVLSLEDQRREIQEMVVKSGINIVKWYPGESRTAHKRGRPVYGEMMNDIESGVIDGVAVWHANRLARNAFDGGLLITLIDEKKLAVVKTPTKEYYDDPNDKFFLQFEFGMAKKTSDDGGVAVKRALNTKKDMGWRPGSAPPGYKNSMFKPRGENDIEVDLERFPIVRKAWDLMLTGNYTADEILWKVNNEWGYRSRKTRVRGDRPMSRSTIYRIFTDLFFAGLIIGRDGNWKKGEHTPMVTIEEYDQVQIILGREGKRRPNRHEYAFTGLFDCGDCERRISATFKEKVLKSTKRVATYSLYYCPHGRKHPEECSQGLYTNVDTIEGQIAEEIEKFRILPEFQDWALTVLAEQSDQEIDEQAKIYAMQQKTVADLEKQFENIRHMRARDMITDEEFLRDKERISNELTLTKAKMSETGDKAATWRELTKRAFKFACHAKSAFVSGNTETKRAIVSAMGLNWRLKDHMLTFEPVEWLIPIIEQKATIESRINEFELAKVSTESKQLQRQKVALATLRPNLRERRDSNPQPRP